MAYARVGCAAAVDRGDGLCRGGPHHAGAACSGRSERLRLRRRIRRARARLRGLRRRGVGLAPGARPCRARDRRGRRRRRGAARTRSAPRRDQHPGLPAVPPLDPRGRRHARRRAAATRPPRPRTPRRGIPGRRRVSAVQSAEPDGHRAHPCGADDACVGGRAARCRHHLRRDPRSAHPAWCHDDADPVRRGRAGSRHRVGLSEQGVESRGPQVRARHRGQHRDKRGGSAAGLDRRVQVSR